MDQIAAMPWASPWPYSSERIQSTTRCSREGTLAKIAGVRSITSCTCSLVQPGPRSLCSHCATSPQQPKRAPRMTGSFRTISIALKSLKPHSSFIHTRHSGRWSVHDGGIVAPYRKARSGVRPSSVRSHSSFSATFSARSTSVHRRGERPRAETGIACVAGASAVSAAGAVENGRRCSASGV